MSLSSTVFIADIPAGSYAVGDVIPLTLDYGSANVLNGHGQPILKEIISGAIAGGSTGFNFYIQNSSWIEPVINGPANMMGDPAALLAQSTGVQSGHDCPLDIMSTWTVYAKCCQAVTNSAADIFFVQIETQYGTDGIADPHAETGTPCSLELTGTLPVYAAASDSAWTTVNVDMLKPNAKYLLEKISMKCAGTTPAGFVAFANAANMDGLSRVIPFRDATNALSMMVKYANAETKGSMDIRFKVFDTAAAASSAFDLILDYVKRAE